MNPIDKQSLRQVSKRPDNLESDLSDFNANQENEYQYPVVSE